MKKYLLDTHYILWAMKNPENITKPILEIIENPENVIYVSRASLWEIAIKLKIGKLEILDSLRNFRNDVGDNNFIWLTIEDEHIFETLEIPLMPNHRDPFDRLILAQAKSEQLILITDDQKFKQYSDIEVIGL